MENPTRAGAAGEPASATSVRTDGAVAAVIPLKALAEAKSRLSSALDGSQRRRLMVLMFDHVVAVCLSAPSIERVLVVAGDQAAADVARAYPVQVLDDIGAGLNAAIARADQDLHEHATDRPHATLVVAADLPGVRVEEIEELAWLGAQGPCVVVAPTTDGGTGALLRRPGTVIAPAYGLQSCSRHLLGAQRVGARSARVHLAGMAHDVDSPSDLAHVAKLDGEGSGRQARRLGRR